MIGADRAPPKNNKNEKDYTLSIASLLFGLLRDAKGIRGPKQKTGDNQGLVPGRESAKAKKESLDCYEHSFCGHAAGLCDSIGYTYLFETIDHGKKQKAPKTFKPKEHKEPQKAREEGAREPCGPKIDKALKR